MIRCIVCDDEPLILRSIVRKIQNLNPEFRVVATAVNGQEGCRIIKEYRPDVIFTDIYMPIMNGLEMIACVREEMISAKYVILSGYREFEFAKQAIKYGVKDYLLKPIDNQRLSILLKELSAEIGQRKRQEKKELLECIKYGVSAPVTIDEADNIFFEAGKLVLFECKICIGSYIADRVKQEEIKFCVNPGLDYETACKKVCQGEGSAFFIFYGPRQNEVSIYFLTGTENDHNNIARQFYQSVKRHLSEGCYLTCTVSHTVTSLKELGRIEREAESILYHEQIFALSSIICSNDEKRKPLKLPEEKFQMLKKSAEEGDRGKISETVFEILKYCEEKECTQFLLWNTVRRIFLCFSEIPENKADHITDLTVYNSSNYMDLLSRIKNWEQEEQHFEACNINEPGPEDIIKKIDDYIVKHYRDSIRVQDIAQKFGFNYSYLCTVFRKYKGISPNEYIIEKRVQEAKFLLRTYPEMTVKEIADRVGYKDSLYFSRIFKKNTSYSPADYRHFAVEGGRK